VASDVVILSRGSSDLSIFFMNKEYQISYTAGSDVSKFADVDGIHQFGSYPCFHGPFQGGLHLVEV
jgi:hypothetical protein